MPSSKSPSAGLRANGAPYNTLCTSGDAIGQQWVVSSSRRGYRLLRARRSFWLGQRTVRVVFCAHDPIHWEILALACEQVRLESSGWLIAQTSSIRRSACHSCPLNMPQAKPPSIDRMFFLVCSDGWIRSQMKARLTQQSAVAQRRDWCNCGWTYCICETRSRTAPSWSTIPHDFASGSDGVGARATCACRPSADPTLCTICRRTCMGVPSRDHEPVCRQR